MFVYNDAILERYPTIRAGVIHAVDVTNSPSSPELLEEYRAEQRAVLERLQATPIAEHPSIAAWRRAFTAFGAKPTQYRNAAEALLRRLDKHGDIPTISTLVDSGNLVSIRYAMPVAVIDQGNIAGTITVRFATGSEEFTDLRSSEVVHPEPGEVIFADIHDVVSARRWCWRQSAQSATGATTTVTLFVIEGHHDGAEEQIASAVGDLMSLLARHQPSSRIETFELSPSKRRAEVTETSEDMHL